MENNIISVNLNNLTDEEREQLLKLVEKSNSKKGKVWKPEDNEFYYYINSVGTVIQTQYSSQYVGNNKYYELGNCFKTREEAEFAAEKQKLITEIKRYITENDLEELDWENCHQCKLYIYYDFDERMFNVDYQYCGRNMNTIYFSDKLAWKKMISDIGEDRIKRYLFEVI